MDRVAVHTPGNGLLRVADRGRRARSETGAFRDSPMSDDPRDARIRELEAALAEIAHQAQAAKMALCETELWIRLDTILRRAEAVRRGSAP